MQRSVPFHRTIRIISLKDNGCVLFLFYIIQFVDHANARLNGGRELALKRG